MKTGTLKHAIRAVRALLAALVIGPFAASADVQTFTVGYNSLPVGLPNSSGPHQLVVPQFDPGLGTLESVDILLTMDSWLYHQFENTGNATTATLTVTDHVQTVRLLDPFGGPDLVTQVHTLSDSHVAGAKDGVTDYAGTGGVTVGHLRQTTDSASFLPGPVGYEGFGTVTFVLDSASGLLSYSATGGNNSVRLSTELDAELTINYNFTPVPEASTLWSGAGILVIGLGMGLRRMRPQAAA